MSGKAVLLLLCDNRSSWPSPQEIVAGATLSPDSVAALPLKRDHLRKFADQSHLSVEGEVILELEKATDMEFVVNATVQKLSQSNGEKVICGDRSSLEEAGIFGVLQRRLQDKGLTIVEPN
jgi:hypothetical protein